MSGGIDLFSITPQSTLINQSSTEEPDDQSASQELMNSFGETFKQKLNQVEDLQKAAQTKMKQYAAGEIDDVHDVSIAMQKANMSLNIASAVRRKLLEGFDELQQMR